MSFDYLGSAPQPDTFVLTSSIFSDGGDLPGPQYSAMSDNDAGVDASPPLSWSGVPSETKSFALTLFDPDAQDGKGFWHWLIADIPSDVRHLNEGLAGGDGSLLPVGVRHFENGAGMSGYLGAAPPERTGRHRYIFTMYALPIDHISIGELRDPASVNNQFAEQSIARATLTAHGQAATDSR